MGENTAIEWTDATFNPWMGCTKVSGACKHCYAETMMDHRYGKVEWGPKGSRVRTSAANWRKPLAWNRKAGPEGRRMRVFCASLADVFEGADTMPAESWPVVEQARADLWALIEATPNLDWLLLTKRPENVLEKVPTGWVGCGECGHRATISHACPFCDGPRAEWPANAWIGTTVEDQASADERIPHLLRVPAKVRFLSCEPLLGPVALNRATAIDPNPISEPVEYVPPLALLSWVICGAESLNKREGRKMDLSWVRSLRDQCADAGVQFFLKQAVVGGRVLAEPLLDGRRWSGVPQAPTEGE